MVNWPLLVSGSSTPGSLHQVFTRDQPLKNPGDTAKVLHLRRLWVEVLGGCWFWGPRWPRMNIGDEHSFWFSAPPLYIYISNSCQRQKLKMYVWCRNMIQFHYPFVQFSHSIIQVCCAVVSPMILLKLLSAKSRGCLSRSSGSWAWGE